MDRETLQRRVDAVRWWHRFYLSHDEGGVIITQGPQICESFIDGLKIPVDLTGQSVLDLGAADGWFSFEAERRGAAYVVAVDWWNEASTPPAQGGRQGFDLVREVLGSKVLAYRANLDDAVGAQIDHDLRAFNVIFCFGLIYHLRNPLRFLDFVREHLHPEGLLILETHVDLLDVRGPAAAFYPRNECCNDYTNGWGPNPPAVLGWLESAGLEGQLISLRLDPYSPRLCVHARHAKWEQPDEEVVL
jgi:tRNA (mo5U34)-methyltransferase